MSDPPATGPDPGRALTGAWGEGTRSSGLIQGRSRRRGPQGGKPGEPHRGQAGNGVAGRLETRPAPTPHARPRPRSAFGGPRELHKRLPDSRRGWVRAEEAPLTDRQTVTHTHRDVRSPPYPHPPTALRGL